jgi:YegS/Rv2252/BmrU family lipid kinase
MRTKAELEHAIRSGGRTVLIVNTRSRRGRRLFAAARRSVAIVRPVAALPVPDPERLSDTFHAALELRPDLIVVGGGDGTLKEAVAHLVHRDVALGVLPLGTTNNFARSLGLPLGLRGAGDVIRSGKVADVDAGLAEGIAAGTPYHDVFANMVSLGMSVEVAERVPAGLKRVVGRSAYALTALRSMPGHRPFRAKVLVDSSPYEITTHQLNIANGAHHSGRPFARDAGPDDRLLTVYRLGDEWRYRLAGAMLRHVLTGHRRTLTEDEFVTTREVYVETDPPMAVDVDGEIRGFTPVRVKLLPNALRVLVPQDFVDT